MTAAAPSTPPRDAATGDLTVRAVACCPPLHVSPLSAAEAEAASDLLKVLADPVRLRLVSLVASSPTGECCACDLVEPVGRSQPTVSHHLGALVDAGVLAREKRGRWVWYTLRPEAFAALRTLLEIG